MSQFLMSAYTNDDRPMTRFSYSDNDLITLTSNYTLYYYQGVEIFQFREE